MNDPDRARRIFDILSSICLDQCYCDNDNECHFCQKLERARQILGEEE